MRAKMSIPTADYEYAQADSDKQTAASPQNVDVVDSSLRELKLHNFFVLSVA